MIAAITLHVIAAALLALSGFLAMATGIAMEKGDREKSIAGILLTSSLATITFALLVIA